MSQDHWPLQAMDYCLNPREMTAMKTRGTAYVR